MYIFTQAYVYTSYVNFDYGAINGTKNDTNNVKKNSFNNDRVTQKKPEFQLSRLTN